MRKIVLFSTLLLLSSSSVWAADRWRISVLASEIASSGNRPWSDETHAGAALGIAFVPSQQWDVELTVASQTHTGAYTRFFYFPAEGQPGDFVPATEFREYRVNPVDLSATRHFLADRVIAPYVRAGVRYVDAPDDPRGRSFFAGGPIVPNQPIPVSEGFGFRDRVSAQAGAGVRVNMTQRLALRAEATRLLRSEATEFDPLTRFAVGVSWGF